MDFSIPQEAKAAQDAVAEWARRRPRVRGSVPSVETYDRDVWREAVGWAVLGLADADQPALTRAVIFAEIARRVGLPGPLLEADVAGFRWPQLAVDALEHGRVVTTVPLGPAGPTLVGWGGVADLVVDESSGAVVAESPLPGVARFAYPFPHAWWHRPADSAGADSAAVDPAQLRKWVIGAALTVGLARGALDLTVEHTRNRTQFGRPLAANQAIQFPLAECMMQVESSWFMVADAAAKQDAGDPLAASAAALAWINTERVAQELSTHCHQAFGALGFCFETGLVDFTWPMKWLRSTLPRSAAVDAVRRRRARRFTSAAGGCLVLEGFVTDGPAMAGREGST